MATIAEIASRILSQVGQEQRGWSCLPPFVTTLTPDLRGLGHLILDGEVPIWVRKFYVDDLTLTPTVGKFLFILVSCYASGALPEARNFAWNRNSGRVLHPHLVPAISKTMGPYLPIFRGYQIVMPSHFYSQPYDTLPASFLDLASSCSRARRGSNGKRPCDLGDSPLFWVACLVRSLTNFIWQLLSFCPRESPYQRRSRESTLDNMVTCKEKGRSAYELEESFAFTFLASNTEEP